MKTNSDESKGTHGYDLNEMIGDYLIEERLGGGDHSSTFMGINKITNEKVAIKVFNKSSPLSVNLYKSEIRAYKALRTLPGILQLKDDGEDDGIYFIVTDFIQEGSLRDILNGYPEGMSIEDVIELFSPIADAIDSIHGKNIIHRDLKPENVLVRKTGKDNKIFITGFGVAKFTIDSQQSQIEHPAGTSWYIAPEAWKSDPHIPQTKALDIYALGVMLYEALEGKLPFDDITDVLNNSARSPEWTKHKTNQDVVDSLLKALNQDPSQRPASAREIIETIENAHKGNLNKAKKWVGHTFKHYLVEEVLGNGELGFTLLAMDTKTSKRVVLKAFEHSLFGTPPLTFDKEIASLERLENGHGILTPQETFEEDDVLFMVTDYQSGGTLRQLLSKRPKLTIKEILEIFSQLAEAIDYIHENKISHRNIKPENVICNITDGRISSFLTDFGISFILAGARSYFHTEHSVGTYRYLAPELWKPNAKKTKAVDIYAFGIMLYEALEGQVPFYADYPAIMSQHLSTPVPAAKKTFKELGDKAHKILIQALAKDAEERPKTATEIIHQIKGHYTKFLGKQLGKYTIEKFIGRGAYGATYQAYDSSHKRKKFALKILSVPKPNLQDIPQLKGLGKDNGVLPILDSGSENDIYYIVTEYLNGNSLRDMLQDSLQGLRLEEVLKIFKPVARALDSLHSVGGIHGDLKPENIVFYKNKDENSLQALISDYGIFKAAGKTHTPYFKFNFSAGNIAYMAPEVWEEKELSAATDIYAFGVMLYEALEGTLPFHAKSLIGMMRQHLNDEPPVPQHLLKLRGRNAVNALLQSLEKNREHRQKSASELVSQLEATAQEGVNRERVSGQDQGISESRSNEKVTIIFDYASETSIKSLELTPETTKSLIAPYLEAIENIQLIFDELNRNKVSQMRIRSITQNSPISASVEGVANAAQIVEEMIVPWKRNHSKTMATLSEQEKQVVIEKTKSEVLEIHARASKERAEKEKILVEITLQNEQVEKLRLENELVRLKLQQEQIQLAMSILEQIGSLLPEDVKVSYIVRLLPFLETIISSPLEILVEQE